MYDLYSNDTPDAQTPHPQQLTSIYGIRRQALNAVDPSGLACLVKYVCYFNIAELESEGCYYRCWEKIPYKHTPIKGTGTGKHWTCDDFKKAKRKLGIKRHKVAHWVEGKGCDCPGASTIEFSLGWDGVDPKKACSLRACNKDCDKKAGAGSNICGLLPSKPLQAACKVAMRVGGSTCKSFCSMTCFKP